MIINKKNTSKIQNLLKYQLDNNLDTSFIISSLSNTIEVINDYNYDLLDIIYLFDTSNKNKLINENILYEHFFDSEFSIQKNISFIYYNDIDLINKLIINKLNNNVKNDLNNNIVLELGNLLLRDIKKNNTINETFFSNYIKLIKNYENIFYSDDITFLNNQSNYNKNIDSYDFNNFTFNNLNTFFEINNDPKLNLEYIEKYLLIFLLTKKLPNNLYKYVLDETNDYLNLYSKYNKFKKIETENIMDLVSKKINNDFCNSFVKLLINNTNNNHKIDLLLISSIDNEQIDLIFKKNPNFLKSIDINEIHTQYNNIEDLISFCQHFSKYQTLNISTIVDNYFHKYYNFFTDNTFNKFNLFNDIKQCNLLLPEKQIQLSFNNISLNLNEDDFKLLLQSYYYNYNNIHKLNDKNNSITKINNYIQTINNNNININKDPLIQEFLFNLFSKGWQNFNIKPNIDTTQSAIFLEKIFLDSLIDNNKKTTKKTTTLKV